MDLNSSMNDHHRHHHYSAYAYPFEMHNSATNAVELKPFAADVAVVVADAAAVDRHHNSNCNNLFGLCPWNNRRIWRTLSYYCSLQRPLCHSYQCGKCRQSANR